MDAYTHPGHNLSRRRSESLERLRSAARKLFIDRGYDATRPQDIAREAGLGHGTFYLHYEDKCDCFLAFLDDARTSFHVFIRSQVGSPQGLDDAVGRTLEAIYLFQDQNPGLLKAAMADGDLIAAEGPRAHALAESWGREWTQIIRDAAKRDDIAVAYDFDIIGQAILGAIQQGQIEGARIGANREDVIFSLKLFLLNALKPCECTQVGSP